MFRPRGRAALRKLGKLRRPGVDNIGIMNPRSSGTGLGVYVHVPFCERVCPYCDFAVEGVRRVPEALEREYVALVIRELDAVLRERPGDLAGRSLETLYLGGGTPSLLTPEGVACLIGSVRERIPGEPLEVTLELNPGTTALDRLPGFRKAGVTRLSLGVQSFDDGTLKRLGRAHRGEDALRAVEAALRCGFASNSADLIYGAPGQTAEGVRRDVRRMVDFAIPHVSAYALTLEPETPFGRASARGRLHLPSEESVAGMSWVIEAELRASGYERYEVSSYARSGHRSLHNERYWRRRDVLGLGPSAASLIGGLRTRNLRERARWAAEVQAGRPPLEEIERVSPMDARRESLFVGFRMPEGVSRAEYWRRYGRRPEDDFGPELAELRGLGLVEDAGGCLRPTALGLLHSNEVLLRFSAVDPPGLGG